MFKAIQRFWERGRKGYCYEDLWEFDNWLSALISRGLREFKQNCHTYPNDCTDWEQWEKIQDEMIECFEEQLRNTDNLLREGGMGSYDKAKTNRKKKLHRGFELLERYYYDLWN